MRKNLAGIGVLICFAFMLLFPKDVFNGASKGLLLWFHTVFPTLFPFLIITNLLMSTNCIRLIARLFGPLLKSSGSLQTGALRSLQAFSADILWAPKFPQT